MLKDAYYQPVNIKSFTHSKNYLALDGSEALDSEGNCVGTGVSLVDTKVVSAILCNYAQLKKGSYSNLEGDMWYLLKDFDRIAGKALAPYPLYERLMEMKIDGFQNAEIQNTLEKEFGVRHSMEYISSLWRKKIPALIAS